MIHSSGLLFFQRIYLFLLFIALLPALPSRAQTVGPVPELAAELSPHFTYDLENNIYYSLIKYAKVASTAQVLPNNNSKSTGTVYTTFLSAGLRTIDFDDVEFRWRAGLLNMDLIRLPISMGATLLDYNQSEHLDLDVKWVNLRLGPSVYIGNPRNYFTLRAVGQAGITTFRFGTFAYEGLASNQDLNFRKRSYEVGYIGEMKVFLFNTLQLSAALHHRHMLGGIRPLVYELQGSLGFRINGELSLIGSYSFEMVEAGSSSLDRYYIALGVGYLL